jgi:delta 1-pyrroline-5-carboxylate dehydrogenase
MSNAMSLAQAVVPAVRHEPMRIAGRKVDADGVIEVRYPYTGAVIGTVPAGTADHAREAFAIAAGYQPKLSRYDRQRILFRTAEILQRRRVEIGELITLELGISRKDSDYEVGRAYDVFTLAAQHPRRRRDLQLRPDTAWQAAQDLHAARTSHRHRGHHAVQPPAQHGRAQGGAGHRHQQPRRLQADRTDAAHRARARRRALRGGAAARDVLGRHRLAA